MREYPKYKQSKTPWVGEIPIDWTDWKVSRLFRKIGSGTTPKAGTAEYYENGTIPWVNTGDLNDGYLHDCQTYITEKALEEHSTLKIYDIDTLLIAMYGATIGKTSILKFKACTNQACCALGNSKLIDIKFAFYWFIANKQHIINLSYGGGQPNISQDVIKSLKIPICDFEGQTQIVKYLDYKTLLIDDFIASRKNQIDLLREQKTSIINKAVTKGIDPTVKMKASGVKWIGNTPEHWEIKKIKHIKARIKNAFVDGPFGSNLKSEHFVDDGKVLVIESGFITSGEFILSDFKKITEEHFETIRRSEAKAGDIIIAKIGFNYGMSGILPELGALSVVSGNSLKLTVNEKENITKYIHYLFLYLKKEGAFELIVNETAQPAISLTRLNNVAIAIPEKKEQQRILDYLKIETSKLEDLISKYQKQIELMQEYRTAIISQAVTGKIDVQEWQPKAKELQA